MKKVIFSACLLVSTLSVMKAQPVPTPMPPASPLPPGAVTPDVPAPKVQNIEFVQFKEIVFDFGNLKAGIPASHTFEFKNVGDKDITIDNVNASCGCTTPNWKGGIYKPGETGQVTATYNANAVGGFNKVVTVTTSEGSIVLTITGTVLDAAAYDEWKAKKDADDAAKAAEEAAKVKAKGGKTKAKTTKTTKTTKKPAATKATTTNKGA